MRRLRKAITGELSSVGVPQAPAPVRFEADPAIEGDEAAAPPRLRAEGARVAQAAGALTGCERHAGRDAEQRFESSRPANSTTRPGTSQEGR